MNTLEKIRKFSCKIIIIITLSLGFNKSILGETFSTVNILDWDENRQKFLEKEIAIEDLHILSPDVLILEHFEIRSGMDSEPMGIEKALGNKRILTLAYHLSKAEKILNLLMPRHKQKGHSKNARVIVRVDAPYVFSPLTYVDRSKPLRNTAVTIPPSQFNPQSEIWFGPKWSFPTISNFSTDRIIDTALCPDAIYHEFIHLYTGNYLGRNTIGRSLSEGISDYFAASFIDFPELYSPRTCSGVKNQLFVRSFHLDTNLGIYNKDIESNFKTDFNFIPGFLWKYRNFVGKELADKSIWNAISKSSPTTRFYPEFVNELTNALYEEKKSLSDVHLARELVLNVEHNILNPHGLFSSFSKEETIFSLFYAKSQIFQNQDERTNQLCENENLFEILSNDFSIDDPTLRMVWKCDGVKMPFVIDFDQNLPTSFQICNPIGYISGTMKFASLNPSLPNPVLSVDKRSLYFRMLKFASSKYFHYRTKEREMRLYFRRDALSTRPEITLEFAYPNFTEKGFIYRL